MQYQRNHSGIRSQIDTAQFNVCGLPGDGQEMTYGLSASVTVSQVGRRAMSCQRMPLRCWKPMKVLFHEPFHLGNPSGFPEALNFDEELHT